MGSGKSPLMLTGMQVQSLTSISKLIERHFQLVLAHLPQRKKFQHRMHVAPKVKSCCSGFRIVGYSRYTAIAKLYKVNRRWRFIFTAQA